MKARGSDFLELWIDGNVLPGPEDRTQARKLAQKLVIDARAAGFKLADMGIEPREVQNYIMDIMVHVGKAGTPGARNRTAQCLVAACLSGNYWH